MKRIAILILVASLIMSQNCIGQLYKSRLDSLCIMCDRSTSDSEKIVALGNLANHFYIYKLNSKGDSVLHEQLLLAELSNNSNLILHALFGDAILNISPSSSRASFENTIDFIRKGIDYARLNKKYDYLVLGYTRMSEILRKRGDYDNSFLNATSALSLLRDVSSDSVKAIAYIEFGESCLPRGDAVLACTNFNNAFDISVKIKSAFLQTKVYHCLAEMYKSLDDAESARIELGKSFSMNQKAGNARELLIDYIDLARLTDEKFFITRSIALADSLRDYKTLLSAKRLLLVYTYVVEKKSSEAFGYLEKEADLKQSYLNDGWGNYLVALGNIFFYTGSTDSALHYYGLAEPELVKGYERNLTKVNYEQTAECFRLRGDISQAITYYEKALAISKELNDVNGIAFYSGNLSLLFEKKMEFEKALQFSRQSETFKDSIRGLSKQNDIALLGVDRENKKHAQDLLEQQQRVINNRNMQYFGITLTLIVIFFIMLYIGSFPVSRLTVRLMGYFFFISLFEFIVLVIDNQVLSRAFHNEPVKLWLIKIGLIALLVPLQHFLEHNVIQLLASKKLITARTNFSIKKWWIAFRNKFTRIKGLEDEEAVL